MQKMNNVLLASNKAESQPNSDIKLASNDNKSSENSDFSTALKQASVEAKQPVNAKSAEKNTAKAASEPTNTPSLDSEVEQSVQVQSIDTDDTSDGDLIDVSHVLAQINLAAELSYAASNKVNGDILPLDDLLIEDTSIEEMAAALNIESESLDEQLLDEQLLSELMNQSGLSQEELEALPPETLSQLIALVKNGEGSSQEIIDLSRNAKSIADNTTINSEALSKQNQVKGPEVQTSGTVMSDSIANKNPLKAATTDNEQNRLDKLNQFDVSKDKFLVQGSKDTSIHTQELTSKDKGEGIKFNTILGEKLVSQTEIISANTKPLTEGQVAAEEQLKGAELSVKLTPMKAGMELSSAFSETTSGAESKLQSASSQLTPQQATRTDIAQIQLSLKQSNEQQVQMQDMIQRFSPVMKQQLITMVSQGIQHAEIRLDPPELGQLMVRIQVQGDQTQVQFHVAQHQTRDLIEQAIPRLKELLSEQGMQLVDSQVSQDNRGNDADGEQSSEEGGGQFGSELDEMSSEESLISSKQATSYPSGIDYYA
ncbi:flagellar hook-length control protein FliK [Shewanella hanedai]|uniref:Flagellar hook-length control protein FliK n=1 Tax=Shewanella hanedai TaxID=25 RepID=A0A553JT73_SHEHA|nr:flagellar hook-length control protein FliK [Shewanella hanedai]TRY15656.1 flagellar hook-length control protein FliK [Shewanella hanedai]GGI71636.1 flagellar hook-length control protein FliK [Shewanella hanedai]